MTERFRRNCRNYLLFAGRWLVFAVCGSVSISIWAQAPAAPTPSFEVASVRQVPEGRGYFSISPSGDKRFSAENASMKLLVAMAFGINDDQISGKNLDWIASKFYDVEAAPAGDVPLSYDQLRIPLQQLLAQRFHLAFHHEWKNMQGYALIVAKGGSKLTAAKDISATGYILQDGLRSPSLSMRSLAAMLAHPLGQPVMNKTDIAGNYDINLHFAPDGSTDSPYPSIFTAVQEQLGLKLEPQKVPVQMLVIDHLEQTPTPN
ncbi:MAG: TIGR03435 family protein [Edaphobacter sp.]